MSMKAETVGTVRERERESYTLVTESAVLFNSLTHTGIFTKRINKKTEKSYTLNNSAVLLSILKYRNKIKHRLFIYVHFLCT